MWPGERHTLLSTPQGSRLSRPEDFVSHGLRVLQWPFWMSYHGHLSGGLLHRWLSFWKVLLTPQINSGALTETIRFLVTSLIKSPLPQFRWLARVLKGSKVFCCTLEPACRSVWAFYRQLCSIPNPVQSSESTTGGLQLSC